MDDYKLYDIYPCQIAGFPFAVRENSDGKPWGDGIFETREEAEESVTLMKLRAEEKRTSKLEREEKEVKEEKERQEYLDSYKGWLSDNPMKRGRQLKVMERQCKFNGEFLLRKEFIEKYVKEGWTANEDNGRLERDDCFFEAGTITKTALDYAKYLGKQ